MWIIVQRVTSLHALRTYMNTVDTVWSVCNKTKREKALKAVGGNKGN